MKLNKFSKENYIQIEKNFQNNFKILQKIKFKRY